MKDLGHLSAVAFPPLSFGQIARDIHGWNLDLTEGRAAKPDEICVHAL
jgi:hypothetical protein